MSPAGLRRAHPPTMGRRYKLARVAQAFAAKGSDEEVPEPANRAERRLLARATRRKGAPRQGRPRG